MIVGIYINCTQLSNFDKMLTQQINATIDGYIPLILKIYFYYANVKFEWVVFFWNSATINCNS